MGQGLHRLTMPGCLACRAHFTAGQVTEEVLHGRTDLVIHAGDIAVRPSVFAGKDIGFC